MFKPSYLTLMFIGYILWYDVGKLKNKHTGDEMTERQELINKVATKIARTNDYHLHSDKSELAIKVIEITTDENESYLMNATESQWDRFSTAVLKLAEQLHWDRYHVLFD